MTKLSSPLIINRRNFLKVSGLAAGTLAALRLPKWVSSSLERGAQSSPETETIKSSKLYRGTKTGSVLISQDHGQTWQLHSHFGPTYSIRDIFTDADGWPYLQASFKEYTFDLVLAKNEKDWLSQSNTIR